MTGIAFYADLLENESRVRAFERGIAELVRPGDRVLDLGTGLGTYAFFAARAGAERVWGVDAHEVVHVAEQLALVNGLQDRVTFVHGTVPDVELPRVDVLIFEDFPTSLLDGAKYALLSRVVGDVLGAGGRMIPAAGRVSVAPVRATAQHERAFPMSGREQAYGLDWTALRPLLANAPRRVELRPDQLAAVPLRSPVVPLLPLPGAAELRVAGAWDATGPERIHALALWFDLEVSAGNWISNEPGSGSGPWGQLLLPLDPPLDVPAPARLHASVGREALPSGGHGWLTWEVRCGDEARTGHEFAGLLLGVEDLAGARAGR